MSIEGEESQRPITILLHTNLVVNFVKVLSAAWCRHFSLSCDNRDRSGKQQSAIWGRGRRTKFRLTLLGGVTSLENNGEHSGLRIPVRYFLESHQ